jgi:hypothetical protein
LQEVKASTFLEALVFTKQALINRALLLNGNEGANIDIPEEEIVKRL